ncbi:MAG TPA: type II toxin-antitoxin system HicA family toxin [Bacteroidales bacterium]|nr:type II toxin-antitoxin system HicA family toxin [Bacteroidales bacterium]
MNYRELTRRLNHLNCVLDRQARGSHEIWINLHTGARTTIPNWGNRDLKPGTVSNILRDLGIAKKDFEGK